MYNTQSSVSSLNMKFLQNLLLFFFFSKFTFHMYYPYPYTLQEDDFHWNSNFANDKFAKFKFCLSFDFL